GTSGRPHSYIKIATQGPSTRAEALGRDDKGAALGSATAARRCLCFAITVVRRLTLSNWFARNAAAALWPTAPDLPLAPAFPSTCTCSPSSGSLWDQSYSCPSPSCWYSRPLRATCLRTLSATCRVRGCPRSSMSLLP